MANKPTWMVIAKRELMVRIRTKWFIIVTLLGPVLMVGMIIGPGVAMVKKNQSGTKIAMVDKSGKYGPEIAGSLWLASKAVGSIDVEQLPPTTSEEALQERIKNDEIKGYLVIPADVLDGGTVTYRGSNVANSLLMRVMDNAVERSVWIARWKAEGRDLEEWNRLTAGVDFDVEHTTGEGEAKSPVAALLVGFLVMFTLYMAILLYAINVMRSVVEEKTSRVIEVMVSTIKSTPLMLGKVLGVGSVGLLQLSIWAVMAALIYSFRGSILGMVGIAGAAGIDLGLGSVGGDAIFVTLLYFVLGYFFYAALYCAIGAMVNSEQEAQQVQTPVVMLLVIPVLFVQLVAADPRGTLAEVVTLLPFSSPVLMPMRYLMGGASLGEVALSVAILAASVLGVVWLAARIYRVGILMYGKRPSLKELVRWIRHT